MAKELAGPCLQLAPCWAYRGGPAELTAGVPPNVKSAWSKEHRHDWRADGRA